MIARLSREGAANNIFLVVTSAGTGNGGLPFRIVENIRTAVCLEMNDSFKYAEMLRVSRVPVLPERGIKGRGIAYVDGRILEFQTVAEGDGEYVIAGGSWNGERARQIPFIPANPVFDDLSSLEEYQRRKEDRRFLPLGYLAEDASVFFCGSMEYLLLDHPGKSGEAEKGMS